MSFLLPALPIPNFVLFPACTVTLQFGFPALQEQLILASEQKVDILVTHATQSPEGSWKPISVGCVAGIRELRYTKHGIQAKLVGKTRANIVGEKVVGGRLFWSCERFESSPWKARRYPELPGMPEQVRQLREKFSPEVWLDIASFHSPGLPLEQKIRLLCELDPRNRYHLLLESNRSRRKTRRIFPN